jgi:hypothetical protein
LPLRRWLILSSVALLPGCFLFGPLAGHSPVTAERIEPGGKGLFVVRPHAEDADCQLKLASPNGTTPLDCSSEYLVACDASAPESKPFCSVVRETGPVRDSIYSASGRVP